VPIHESQSHERQKDARPCPAEEINAASNGRRWRSRTQKAQVMLVWLVIALFVGDYAYYRWPLEQRPDVAYVGQGAQALILWLCAYQAARAHATTRLQCFGLVFFCIWGSLEALQRSACGLLEWGAVSGGIDLCRKAIGPDWRAAIAAASLTLPVYLFLRRRRD
jgi:hypothetical protein